MNGHIPTLPAVHLPRSRPHAGIMTSLADDSVHRAFRTGGFVMAAACLVLIVVLSHRQASLPSAAKGTASGPLAAPASITFGLVSPGGVQLAASTGSAQGLYALSANGLFYSEDGGGSWVLRSSARELPGQITTMAVDHRNASAVIIASESMGLFKSTDGGHTFNPASLGLAWDASSSISAVHLSTDLPSLALAVVGRWTDASRSSLARQDLYLSNNQGGDWFRVAGLDLVSPASSLYLDPVSLKVHAWSAGMPARPVALEQALLTMMQTGNPLEQDQAITALGLLGARGAEPYLHARFWMETPPHPSTAMALANLGTSTALNALVQALANPQLTARRHSATAALESLGPRATPALQAALESEDATLRANAANLMGWIADPQAAGSLRQAASDPDPLVRQEAAWAISQIAETSHLTGKLAWLDEALSGLLAWQGRLSLAALGLLAAGGALWWTRGRRRVGRKV